MLFLFHLAGKKSSKIIGFIRDVYPFVLFTFFFKEISLLVNLFFPFWFEPYLIAWDIALFGDHAILLLGPNSHAWLTELMAFAYWSYYLMFPLALFVLYRRRRRDMFHAMVFDVTFTMFVCYVCYLIFTARGPQHTLAFLLPERSAAGLFDSMVLSIQATADISGAAFPSSHVAAVWVMLIYLFRARPWLGWLMLVLVIGLTISTVYLNYHYAVDAIAGVLLAGVAYPLARFIRKRSPWPVAGKLGSGI